MDKINRVRQSIQGMLKKMKQDREDANESCSNVQTRAVVRSSSLTIEPAENKIKQKRKAVSVSVSVDHRGQVTNTLLSEGNQIEKVMHAPKEEDKPVSDLIRFSSEEDGATSEGTQISAEMTHKPLKRNEATRHRKTENGATRHIQQDTETPRKKWSKAQKKTVHFSAKPELSNIKIFAANSLQPPPDVGHCVAQYRSD